jgi:hypothetical protein
LKIIGRKAVESFKWLIQRYPECVKIWSVQSVTKSACDNFELFKLVIEKIGLQFYENSENSRDSLLRRWAFAGMTDAIEWAIRNQWPITSDIICHALCSGDKVLVQRLLEIVPVPSSIPFENAMAISDPTFWEYIYNTMPIRLTELDFIHCCSLPNRRKLLQKLKWLVAHGCPLNLRLFLRRYFRNLRISAEVLDYIWDLSVQTKVNETLWDTELWNDLLGSELFCYVGLEWVLKKKGIAFVKHSLNEDRPRLEYMYRNAFETGSVKFLKGLWMLQDEPKVLNFNFDALRDITYDGSLHILQYLELEHREALVEVCKQIDSVFSFPDAEFYFNSLTAYHWLIEHGFVFPSEDTYVEVVLNSGIPQVFQALDYLFGRGIAMNIDKMEKVVSKLPRNISEDLSKWIETHRHL